MKRFIIFRTNNNNNYLYSISHKQFCHLTLDEVNFIGLLKNENEIDEITLSTFIDNKIPPPEDLKLELIRDRVKILIENSIISFRPFNFSIERSNITVNDIKKALIYKPAITFEVTEKCNLKCKYCTYGHYYSFFDQRNGKELSLATAKNCIDFLIEICESDINGYANHKIDLNFYGGEPLLKMDLIRDIVSYAKGKRSHKQTFAFNMTTNALLLHKYSKFLVENNFSILVSLDGDELNNSYRNMPNGENSFDVVVENLKEFRKTYPDYFEKSVDFNSVLHNKNSVDEATGFIEKEFNKTPLISELSDIGLVTDYSTGFSKLYKSKKIDLRNTVKQVAESHEYNELLFIFYNLTNQVYQNPRSLIFRDFNKKRHTGTCLPFSNKIFVSSNGKMHACESIAHDFYFGRASDIGVDIDFSDIAKRFNEHINKMQEQCAGCYNYFNCTACVLQLDKNKPLCKEFMYEKDFADMLSRVFTFLENNPSILKKIVHDTSIF